MENAIPAIVKSELWESVNSNRYKRRESQYNYMLRGIAYCWCGSPLVGGKVGKEPAYRCSNAKIYHLKGHIQIMASILEGRTRDALKATWLDRDEKEIFDRMKDRKAASKCRTLDRDCEPQSDLRATHGRTEVYEERKRTRNLDRRVPEVVERISTA